MPELADQVALTALLGVGALLVGWFFVGSEVMRRRATRLARWGKRVVDPLGGRQSIRWLTQQAFRLEVENPRRPYRSASITGLVESWEVPINWLWNRLNGRRDLVVLQLTLLQPPIWGLEMYRPRTILSGDARDLARKEGWAEEPLGELRLAVGGEGPRSLAQRLLEEVRAERGRLVRLSVRRQDPHITLALSVPDPARLDPTDVERLLGRLAGAVAP